MRISWRTELPQLLLIAAMIAASGWAWSRVPDKVPVHWNAKGEVDRYGGRFEGLCLAPMIGTGVYALLLVIPWLDPKRANYQQFAGAYAVIRFTILGFMAAIHAMLILSVMGRQIPMALVVPALVGALLAVLGVLMSRIKPNWFVGVRTPWTLSSDLSWQKTHQMAGWLLPLAGLGMILSGFLRGEWAIYSMLTVLLGAVIGLAVYSYVVWRQDPARR